MASENKRQSAAVKVPVALPKTDGTQSPGQMVPQEAALHAAVGSRYGARNETEHLSN